MDEIALIKTAQAMVADYKGLIAMDESNPTTNPGNASSLPRNDHNHSWT